MTFRLTLVENKKARAICETRSRYDVVFNGVKIGQLYFNMTGYTGCYLPQPDSSTALSIPEQGITAIRRIIAQLNRTPITTDRFWMPAGA